MGGMGEEEIVIMYHYIENKIFLKDMKYLCSNIINQLVQLTLSAAVQKILLRKIPMNRLISIII